MNRQKFPFFSGGKEYIFWAWKGDYLNLGAGAELGIYSRLVIKGYKTNHWLAETKSLLSMSMTLKCNGRNIATYRPREKQWWITCFNPYYQNVKARSITVIFTVNFQANKKLFTSFISKYLWNRMWKFNNRNYTATLTF